MCRGYGRSLIIVVLPWTQTSLPHIVWTYSLFIVLDPLPCKSLYWIWILCNLKKITQIFFISTLLTTCSYKLSLIPLFRQLDAVSTTGRYMSLSCLIYGYDYHSVSTLVLQVVYTIHTNFNCTNYYICNKSLIYRIIILCTMYCVIQRKVLIVFSVVFAHFCYWNCILLLFCYMVQHWT